MVKNYCDIDYLNTISCILENDNLMDNEKAIYIKMADIVETFSNEELKSYEERSYIHKGKVLTDKERVSYETTRLYKNMNSKPELDKNFVDEQIKRLVYIYERQNKHGNDLQEAKEKITELQIALGIKPKFYTTFPNVLNRIMKSNYFNIINRYNKYMDYYKELNKINK